MPGIKIGDLFVEITRKRIKNINLRVLSPRGGVVVSAPFHVSQETINKFVLSKKVWIEKQQDRIRKRVEIPEMQYVTGETHYLFGVGYTLKLVERKGRQEVRIIGNSMIIYISPGANPGSRGQLISKYYRSALKEKIPPLIRRNEAMMGVRVNEFGIKKMKTRWGTCNSRDKRIWINLGLAKMPPYLLGYIIVHEMTHLIEPSHNMHFKSLMDQYLPNWRTLRKELKNRSI